MGVRGRTVALSAGVLGFSALVLAIAAATRESPAGSDHTSEVNDADIEALGRMLASENPRGTLALWVQQCWTQIHSLKRGQSLYQRITGGKGFGPQNKSRPVATTEAASPTHRMVARMVLTGAYAARWIGARKFFEPGQQDRMYQIGKTARQKRANGAPLSSRESRALGYEKDAAGVRREWASEGARYLGIIEGVEFWT